MNIRSKIFGTKDAVEAPRLLDAKKPKGAKADMLQSIAVSREEFRRGNTRGADRHRLPQEEVALTYKGESRNVQLINVSGGGAMIAGDFEPMLWERVDLRLGDEGVIECAVRWLKDGRIGLEFAHETRLDCSLDEQATLLREVISRSFGDMDFETPEASPRVEESDDNRGARRHPLIWSGSLHYDFETIPVRLRNISASGALIDCQSLLRVGAEPLLDLGDAGSVFATVAWVVGDQAGLKFKAAFDLSQLARSRPQVAPFHALQPNTSQSDAEPACPWDEQWGRMSVSELRDELEGYLKR